MSLSVLSDANVRQMLAALAPLDVSDLVNALEQALISYSCGDEQKYQPHRSVISRPGGQITLFMPASTRGLVGTKIVGIRPTQGPSSTSQGPADTAPALKSVLTLCDATGQAIGILNAAALTAFRTSLGSMLMYRFRRSTAKITVFGAGKQALWHIRLAVLLRGADIRSITVVNRSVERARDLLDVLAKDTDTPWPSHISLDIFDAKEDRESALEALVADSDVLFCTTPSTEPLFPAAYLASDRARSKTRFISAIGSYRPDMQEIDPQLLKMVVDPSGVFSSSGYGGGVVAVDSQEGCAHEAGELIKAGIPPEKIIEVGKVLETKAHDNQEDLAEWLQDGFVIYKSVGIGVMDLAIGHHLLKMGNARGLGLTMPEF